ncbi:hypothetical protein J437_LFUL010658 [Ladona fulva]|uniref:Uncharacterized protein n=1 Tax=Ladona fulva TaxID=123851 RepID=A0A8K0KAV9_LADFU|nr:hypothetical protein J437_LFUL010658 [Ladona fulva]
MTLTQTPHIYIIPSQAKLRNVGLVQETMRSGMGKVEAVEGTDNLTQSKLDTNTTTVGWSNHEMARRCVQDPTHLMKALVGLGWEDSQLPSDPFASLLKQLRHQDRCLCAPLFSACVTKRDEIVTRALLCDPVLFEIEQISATTNLKNPETHKLIVQAYNDSALSYLQEGLEEVVDKPLAGCPSTSTTNDNLACVGNLLNSDHRVGVQMIAETLNIPKTIVHELVTNKLE